jgi:hypothetical protein
VTVTPRLEEGEEEASTRTITCFDEVACVAEAEADLAFISMAVALRKHWECLSEELCPTTELTGKKGKGGKPDFLVTAGDGDLIKNALLAAARVGNMRGMDLCLLNPDWVVDEVYDIQDAADKLGTPTSLGTSTTTWPFSCWRETTTSPRSTG